MSSETAGDARATTPSCACSLTTMLATTQLPDHRADTDSAEFTSPRLHLLSARKNGRRYSHDNWCEVTIEVQETLPAMRGQLHCAHVHCDRRC